MIKLDENNIDNLNELLVNHWDYLNPKDVNNDLTQNSLVKKIESALNDLNNQPNNTTFLDYLLDHDYRNLKGIILSKPDELQNYIDEINWEFGAGMFSTGGNNPTLTDFGRRVSSIFNYTAYRNKNQCKETIDNLRIFYCAYCNKDEIEVVDDNPEDDEMKLYGTIDHFFSHSRYPYLALSFFNLIPSCHKCNSQLKGHKAFGLNTHINPFDKSFNDIFKFRYQGSPLIDSKDLTIEIINNQEFPNNQIAVFNLERRYNTSPVKQVVLAGILGYNNYSQDILEAISDQIGNLTLSIEQYHHFYGLPVDANDIIKTQLGKLKRDICIQIGVLND